MPSTRQSRLYRLPRVLLWFALLPLVVHAQIGDHWAPREANTPVFEGPDRSFHVRALIGPDDVIRQQSNKKIRGFIKVVVPAQNYATGYVLEEKLEFLGGMETQEDPETAALADESKQDAATTSGPPAQESLGWTALGIVLLLAVAVASVGWILFRRPSLSRIPVARMTDKLGSVKGLVPRARRFLHHLRARGTDARQETPEADRSFIDDLLPADFDSQPDITGDPDDRSMATEQAAPDIEQVERLYDLVLQQLESGKRVPALWARAIALAGGNEETAKFRYIELLTSRISEQRLSRQDSRQTD